MTTHPLSTAKFTTFSDVLDRAPENRMSRRYLTILERWIPQGMAVFEPWPGRPGTGHFLGGVLWYCQDTVMPALAFAATAASPEYDPAVAGFDREEVRETALHALRYACFTHDTGPEDCIRPTESWGRTEPAGTKWGEKGKGFFRETNAGRQLANLAATAYLIRDLLGDEERGMLSNMARDYLERYLDYTPPSGLYFDTQMEENSWTAFGLVGAALLLDGTNEYASWIKRIQEWMIHATTTPDDMHDHRKGPDGRSIREWADRRFTTLPDFTAENHGFVHPNYLKSCIMLLGQMSVLLRLWGREIPAAATHHHREIYRVIADWCDDLGLPHAPQGMDWPYVNLTVHCFGHAAAAAHLGIADATLLEQRTLEVLDRQTVVHEGRLIPEATRRSCHGQQDPAIMKERFISHIAYAYLLKRLAGPGPEPSDDTDFRRRQSGVRVYPHGGVAIHTHAKGRTSISWRNGPLVLPATNRGLQFVGHTRQSLLARIETADRATSSKLVFSTIRDGADRLSCAFEELLAEETIRRRVVFASFPEGICFLREIVTAVEAVTVNRLVQGRLSVMNDPIFACEAPPESSRHVTTSGTSRTFAGFAADPDEKAHPETMPLNGWVNVSEELGLVFLTKESAAYMNPHSWDVWHAVEDRIDLGGFNEPRKFEAGEIIGDLSWVWLPEATTEETAGTTIDLVESTATRVCARLHTPHRERLVCCTFGDKPYVVPASVTSGAPSTLELSTGIMISAVEPASMHITIPPREPVVIEATYAH